MSEMLKFLSVGTKKRPGSALDSAADQRPRRKQKLSVFGSDCPKPVQSFEDLRNRFSLPDDLWSNFSNFGFAEPTPVQSQCWPCLFDQRDILICAPTGSGKTLAYLLPIVFALRKHKSKGPRALIIVPTRELAKQVKEVFTSLVSGTKLRSMIISKTSEDLTRFDCVITTPNRLIYQLRGNRSTLDLRSHLQYFVVDESDKLFEAGERGFREQLAQIYSCCSSAAVHIFASATFSSDVERWCLLNLNNLLKVVVGAVNQSISNIKQSLKFCSENGKLMQIRFMFKLHFDPPVLIFVQSKERAKELFAEMMFDSFNVDVIHADRKESERDAVIEAFNSGRVWVLICTDVLGRGIDFKDVKLVINYDFPQTAVSYIHRIGRTGRAGKSGEAITFFTQKDIKYIRSIANVVKQAGCEVPDYMMRIARNKDPPKSLKRDSIRTMPAAFRKKTREEREAFKAESVKKTFKKMKNLKTSK